MLKQWFDKFTFKLIIYSILKCLKGICIDNGSSFTCQCKYTHYGDKCQYQNLCTSRTCQMGGTCTNDLTKAAGYYCTCQEGMST